MAETSAVGAERQGAEREAFPETLQLHGSNHPGMILVDSMVTTWILNSISKDIVQAYTYAKSSRNLWLDLEQRYGGCNGPLLYQLQGSITSLAQGNLSLAEYYTKLKMLWDELYELKPTRQCTCRCTCGAAQDNAESALSTQLLQFLMGLSEEFDNVRQQIHVMEPMPSINKAYSMVASVEKQRMVHLMSSENVVLHTRAEAKREFRGVARKKPFEDRKNQYCDHCARTGHTRETCFKLHGHTDCHTQKAYRLYDLNSHTVFSSRDVTFHETSFPFQQHSPPTDTVPLPVIPLTADTDSLPSSRPSSPIVPTIRIAPESTPSSTPTPTPTLRRSTRQTSKPGWLADYECNCTIHSSSCSPTTYVLHTFVLLLFCLQYRNQGLTLKPVLPQASRQWNLELTTKLMEFGFQQSPHDHCLFVKRSDSCFLALLVYVDDIFLTRSSTTKIDAVKTYLDRLFTIKDLGPAKYFLGLQLARSDHGLLVTQTKYLTDILEDANRWMPNLLQPHFLQVLNSLMRMALSYLLLISIAVSLAAFSIWVSLAPISHLQCNN
ncbi:UNVERIFIED_CONTAM: putative mitochondrial protein [Sesamum latifolium]|uniref:Mitochondrial protein n=1 Tax=Sesamum latifolium TaxID=2727402 RepID=A0AAW2VFJ1_9LAMI